MTRQLTVEANPVAKDRLIAFTQRFAYASVGNARLEWDSNLAAGGTALVMHMVLPDGRTIVEFINLSPMITEWGQLALKEHWIEDK